jgi:hypothetical protein
MLFIKNRGSSSLSYKNKLYRTEALGWSSGLALLYMPLPAVLLLSAALGLAAYAVQYCVLLSGSPSPAAIPYPAVCVLFLHPS